MRLGVAIDLGSAEPVRPQVDRAARLLEVVEANGLSSVWLGESYHTRPEAWHLPASLIVLGHLAGRTDLPLGTAVLLARAYQPRRLAYEAALLDQLCAGRLTLGIALGNADLVQRLGGDAGGQPPGEWFESVIRSLRAAWSPTPDTRLDRFEVSPLPVQAGGPRLLIGGRTAAAAVRAARVGDGYYAATNYSDELLAARATGYWDARAGAAGEVAVTRFCLVAEDTDTARETATRYFAAAMGLYTRHNIWFGLSGPEQSQLPLVGSPDDIVAALRRYASFGVTSVQLRIAPYGTPPEVSSRTMELVRAAVMPELGEV